jgi:hypothetical protein
MKKINLFEANDFSEKGMRRLLVHDSSYFKILNFNFKAGQELPLHSHDIEGQVSLVVLEGTDEFLGKDGASMPAGPPSGENGGLSPLDNPWGGSYL